MRQHVSIFSKFFSSSTPIVQSPDRTKHLTYLKNLLGNSTIYTQTTLFNNLDSCLIEYMLVHPQAGVILLNYFDYDAHELKGLTARSSKKPTHILKLKLTMQKNLFLNALMRYFINNSALFVLYLFVPI